MNLINSSRPQTFFSKLSHTIKKHKFQYANKLYIQPQRLFSSYQRSQSYNQDQKKSYQPLDFDPKIDYYQRLGIQLNASEDEIKKAFYKLAKQYHPDSHLNQSTPQDEHKFKEISAAYDVLSDKEKKTLYDQLREELGREQFKSYSNNRKASEWTYTYNQNWERKQKTAYDNFYQYAHEQQKNQRQRYEGWNYSSAKEEYQSGFKEDSNRKQREQAYKEYYDNFNEEQYKKYEEKMRRDQERAKSQQESKPKSDETNIRNLFLSFLGFSLGTYLIFGGSSSTATEPKYVPSGQVYGSQNSHKPILQKWTNSNFPDSNYYQPSTFKGKIQKKKFDSSTSLDEAYNYYSQFQGDVAIPKMEVKNSSTPIKDVLEKEKEERRILNQKKREAKQKQIQEQKKQNQKVGNKKSDRQEKDFKYKEPEPVQLTNKIKENHLYLRTHDQVLAIPQDYNNVTSYLQLIPYQDKNELNQEELLASIGFVPQTITQRFDENRQSIQNNFLNSEASIGTRIQKYDGAINYSQSSIRDGEDYKNNFVNLSQQQVLTTNNDGEQDDLNQQILENENKHSMKRDYQSYLTKQNQKLQNKEREREIYQEQKDTQRKNELLTITIDLGGGNMENIIVNEGDNAEDLAHQFSTKHGLNARLKELLAIQIQQNIEQVMTEKEVLKTEENVKQSQGRQETQEQYEFVREDDFVEQQNFYQDSILNMIGADNQQNQRRQNNIVPQFQQQQKPQNQYAQFIQGGNQAYQPLYQVNYYPNEHKHQQPHYQQQTPVNVNQKTQKYWQNNENFQDVPKINSNSKKLAMSKRALTANHSVHSRLYKMDLEKNKLAVAKQQMEEHQAQMQNQKRHAKSPYRFKSDPNELNPGVRLYQKGLKIQEEKERTIKEIKETMHSKEVEGLNFRPQINKRSKSNTRNNGTQQEKSQKREIELMNYGKMVQEKKERQRQLYKELEVAQYEFHPKICKKSELIMMEKTGIQDLLQDDRSPNHNQVSQIGERKQKFNELYEDACQRMARQEKIYNIVQDRECTFKPRMVSQESRLAKKYSSCNQSQIRSHINKPQNTNAEGQEEQMDTEGDQPRFAQAYPPNRLNAYRVSNEENIDPKTGKRLFHPQTGRSPLNRDVNPQKIGDHLYNMSKNKFEKQRKLLRDEQLKLAEMQKLQSNKTSDKIIENMKRQKLNEIFDVFDSDSDDHISAQKIELHSIPTELLEVFSPLLVEMEELGQPLDRDEFVDASLRLYHTLNVNQKNQILQFKRVSKLHYQEEQSCSFQPLVCAKSVKMTSTMGSPKMNVVDRLMKKKQEVDEKIKQAQQMKEQQELQGCTFTPHIIVDQEKHQYYRHYFENGGSNGYGTHDQTFIENNGQDALTNSLVNAAKFYFGDAVKFKT